MERIEVIKELASLLTYHPETGELTWNVRGKPGCRFRGIAGHVSTDGYIAFRFKGCSIRAHTVVWFMAYGEIPAMLDHINGHTQDNRLENLRKTNSWLNQKNQARHRAGDTPGVTWHKGKKQWQARIGQKHLGSFYSKELAIQARLAAEKLIPELQV